MKSSPSWVEESYSYILLNICFTERSMEIVNTSPIQEVLIEFVDAISGLKVKLEH